MALELPVEAGASILTSAKDGSPGVALGAQAGQGAPTVPLGCGSRVWTWLWGVCLSALL